MNLNQLARFIFMQAQVARNCIRKNNFRNPLEIESLRVFCATFFSSICFNKLFKLARKLKKSA